MKKTLKSLWLRLHGKHVCEHGDCLNQAMQCHLTAYSDDYSESWDDYYWYCTEHCKDKGFCWGCGEFWAGNEQFDFNRAGLCSNCKDEFDSEEDEYDPECDYGEIYP